MNYFDIEGACAVARYFPPSSASTPEPALRGQAEWLASRESSRNQKIRLMPDAHPGKIGPIGLAMTVGETLLPGLVGIDMGCGVTLAKLRMKRRPDFGALSAIVREQIPAGFAVRDKLLPEALSFNFERFRVLRHINVAGAQKSLGTLGGGNHFLEVDRDEEGAFWLAVHSGSRRVGVEVAGRYMQLASAQAAGSPKGKGAFEEAPLSGGLLSDYLSDLEGACAYAEASRRAMLRLICGGMRWKMESVLSVVHNYVDCSDTVPILRKGAISAKAGEPVAIPINMRDGILLGEGLGNPEWNESAPHGAGRILKRDAVKNVLTVSRLREEMKAAGIQSPSISAETLDEAPEAYRALADILPALAPTVRVTQRLVPVWCFKGGKG